MLLLGLVLKIILKGKTNLCLEGEFVEDRDSIICRNVVDSK